MATGFNQKLDARKLTTNFVGKEVKESMYEYGMYTLEDRSVPNVIDGLKPVYRRAMYAMYQIDAVAGKPHKKVARITGDTIGKYHPHGDTSVSNVIVEMAHTRYQLVDPQGNFGSDLTSAAAPRYIEARLSKFGTMVCDRMNIASMQPNFDGTEKEPVVIPTRIPVLLLNGIPTGIAVGLRIGIPSHNIMNVVNSLTYLLSNDKPDQAKFLDLLDRPDFRECVILSSKEELRQIYETGLGSIAVGPKYSFESHEDGIILNINGIPPAMNASRVVEKIKEYHQEGLVDYVNEDIVSVTTVNGKRPVCKIQVKAASKKFLEETILPHFYTNFYVNLHAITTDEKGQKSVPAFSFFTLAQSWLEEQKAFKKMELTDLLNKRDYELRIAQARYQIVSNKGNVDKLINLLKAKRDSKQEYVNDIMKTFKLDAEQADSLYESKINIIAKLNVDLLASKIEELEKEIKRIKAMLKDIEGCISADLQELLKTFKDENLTVFENEFEVAGSNLKGQALLVGVSQSGKVYTGKFPSNVPDELISDASTGTLVITAEGLPNYYEAGQMAGSLGHSVFGVVPSSFDFAFVLDDTGKAILMDDIGDPKKQVMRDMGKPVRVVGLNKGDVLYASKKKYPTLEILVNEAFIDKFLKRPGSVGTNVYPGHSKDVDVFVWHRKAKLYDETQSEVHDTKIPKMLEGQKKLFNVFKDGNIIRRGTKVELGSQKEALKNFKNLINQ